MLELLGLVSGWYLSSCVAITTSKICMQMLKVPFVLCTCQCLTAVIITLSYLLTRSSDRFELLRSQEITAVAKVSLAYSAGFGLTNIAFSIASAPFVETVKASEPVSTALLAFTILNEQESIATYGSLLPIIVGVALATSGGSSSSMDSLFSFATLVVTSSNLCFSGRAIFAKQLKRTYPASAASRSAVTLFYHVSRIGLPGFLIAALLNQELSTMAYLFFPAVFKPQDAHTTNSAKDSLPPNLLLFAAALFANGLAYTSYNMASFMVLSRVTTTTHAVLNVFRRVVVIAITTLYFRTPITLTGLSGVLLAAAGVALFATCKAADPKVS